VAGDDGADGEEDDDGPEAEKEDEASPIHELDADFQGGGPGAGRSGGVDLAEAKIVLSLGEAGDHRARVWSGVAGEGMLEGGVGGLLEFNVGVGSGPLEGDGAIAGVHPPTVLEELRFEIDVAGISNHDIPATTKGDSDERFAGEGKTDGTGKLQPAGRRAVIEKSRERNMAESDRK